MEDKHVEFSTLDVLRGKASRPVDIDTGTLFFSCTFRYQEAFNGMNYIPVSGKFQQQMIPAI